MWSCQKDTYAERLCFHTELQTRLVSFRGRLCGLCSQSRHFLDECVVGGKMRVCLDTQLVSGFVAAFPHGCSAHFSKLLLRCLYSLRSRFISTLPQTVWPFRVEDVLAVKLKGSWKGSRLMPKRSGLCSVDWQCKPCCIMLWGRSLICWNIGTLTDRCLSSASKVKVTN